MILKLQCKECLAKLQFNGGDRTKLPKAAEVSRAQTDPEVEEEEEEAKEALEEEAVQKKRKMSGRFLSSEALRAVLGCLLGGSSRCESGGEGLNRLGALRRRPIRLPVRGSSSHW